jgi:large subunit ribosomal protein L1
MGKKRLSELGSDNETDIKAKKAVQHEQKKLREGKAVKKNEAPVVEASVTPQPESPVASATSPKKARIRSKAYKAAKAMVNADKTYPLNDALALLKKVSLTKFDPTVELHLTLLDKGFNKDIELPYATGKTRKIAVADADTMAKIAANKIDFDILLASPDQMGGLVKYAKVLGPKGLMPNPKNGTVVQNPEAAAKSMTGKNSLPLKTEKDAPLIHTQIGKLSFGQEKLSANINAILSIIPKLQKIVIKTTMSPAIKIQL